MNVQIAAGLNYYLKHTLKRREGVCLPNRHWKMVPHLETLGATNDTASRGHSVVVG